MATAEIVEKAEAWYAARNKNRTLNKHFLVPVRHSDEWSDMFRDYMSKTVKVNYPPTGANRRYQVQCDGKAFSGFDDLEQAKAAASMYKKPGNPKRAENSNEKMDWKVVDMNSGAVVFTAPSGRR